MSRYAVHAPELSPEENARWTGRLNDLAEECGCAMGARFVVAYLVAAPFAVWPAVGRHSIAMTLVGVVVGLFIAAAAGKAAGIAIARVRLTRSLDQLRRTIAAARKTPCPTATANA